MNKNILLSVLLFIGIAVAGNFIAFRIVHLPDQFQFVVILGLCLFYPVLRFPLFGVYSLFIILPFIPFIRRLYYLAYSRPAADPLIIIGDIILAVMLLGLFFTFRERIQQGTFRFRIVFLVMAYFLYMVLRTFFFNDLTLNISLLRFRFYGPQVLLFFLGMLYAGEEKHLKRLWGVTLVIAVAAVLYGCKQFFFGYLEAEKLWFSSIEFSSLFIKGVVRPFSFFTSPAAFADYQQVAVIGLIFFSGCSRIAGKMAWVLMPVFWTGVLLTSVRSSWIGMALTLFVWLFIVRVRGLRQRLIFLALLAAAFTMFDVVQTVIQTGLGVGSIVATASGNAAASQNLSLLVSERANAIENPFQEYSLLSRIALWRNIFYMSVDPQMALIGRGLGMLNADSLYMTYLAEFGYPGMLLILVIIILFIKYGFELIDRSRAAWSSSVAVAVVTMDIVFAIISLTGSHIHAFPGDTYFWFWNGVMIGLWTDRTGRNKGEAEHENPADA